MMRLRDRLSMWFDADREMTRCDERPDGETMTRAMTAAIVVAVAMRGRRWSWSDGPAPACRQPARGVTTFPLSQVRVLDGPFKHAQDLNIEYIRALEPDRLLAPYLTRSGTPAEGRQVSELGEHRPRRAHGRPLPHGAGADLGRDRRSRDEAAARLHGRRARRVPARRTATATSGPFRAAASCGRRSPRARFTSSGSPSTANGCPGTTCTSCSPGCAMRI